MKNKKLILSLNIMLLAPGLMLAMEATPPMRRIWDKAALPQAPQTIIQDYAVEGPANQDGTVVQLQEIAAGKEDATPTEETRDAAEPTYLETKTQKLSRVVLGIDRSNLNLPNRWVWDHVDYVRGPLKQKESTELEADTKFLHYLDWYMLATFNKFASTLEKNRDLNEGNLDNIRKLQDDMKTLGEVLDSCHSKGVKILEPTLSKVILTLKTYKTLMLQSESIKRNRNDEIVIQLKTAQNTAYALRAACNNAAEADSEGDDDFGAQSIFQKTHQRALGQ